MSTYRQDRTDHRFLFNEAQSELGFLPIEAVATTVYSRGRAVNAFLNPGGAAGSRARVVNSGGDD